MKLRVRWTVRLRRWVAKAAKRVGRHLISALMSLIVMLIVVDSLGIYFSHDIARDIATRAAVVAAQLLEQGGNRSLTKRTASALVERNLAKFKSIEFFGNEVEVTITYKARSMIFKHVPWVRMLTIITASGSFPIKQR